MGGAHLQRIHQAVLLQPHESDWNKGSPWILRMPDGRVDIKGEVRESDPPRKLVVTWNVDWLAEKLPEIGRAHV